MSETFFKFACFFDKTTVEILILTIILVGLAVLLLGVKVFFVKGGRFPHTHIDGNPEMRKRGIKCVRHDEYYK